MRFCIADALFLYNDPKGIRWSRMITVAFLCAGLMFLCPDLVHGQDSVKQAKNVSGPAGWGFKVEPYLMLPAMNGQVGVGNLPAADLNASVSDIFSKLKFGAMLNVEASNPKWTIGVDFLYMNLEQDLKASNLINSGKVNAKQMGLEVYGMRKLNPWLEIGAGALWNSLSVEMDIVQNQVGGSTISRSGEQTKSWVDPMIMARVKTPGANTPKKLYGVLKGDIGGFGVGSDFAWQLQVSGGYRFSRLFDMSIGYRFIGLDYTDESDGKAFVYDVVTSGLMIRLGFVF
jgi:hypothetical protein